MQPVKKLLPNIRPAAHSASVLEYRDGRMMLTWSAGTFEGVQDQIGVVTTQPPGAQTWAEPRVLIESFDYDGDRWITEQVVPVETAGGDTVVYTWASPFKEFQLCGTPPNE